MKHLEQLTRANVIDVHHGVPASDLHPQSPTSIVHSTPNHHFYTATRGWVAASELRIGESVRAADGSYVTLLRKTARENKEPVYNLHVAETHTYFVALDDGSSVLVHNDSIVESTEKAATPHGKLMQGMYRKAAEEVLLSTAKKDAKSVRKLTADEKKMAQTIFGDSIDLDRVEIVETDSFPNAPTTLGNVIRVQSGHTMTRADLIHELVHVWQFQTQGTAYLTDSVKEQLGAAATDVVSHPIEYAKRAGSAGFQAGEWEKIANTARSGAYPPPQDLSKVKSFHDLGREQQATLIEYYFIGETLYKDPSQTTHKKIRPASGGAPAKTSTSVPLTWPNQETAAKTHIYFKKNYASYVRMVNELQSARPNPLARIKFWE